MTMCLTPQLTLVAVGTSDTNGPQTNCLGAEFAPGELSNGGQTVAVFQAAGRIIPAMLKRTRMSCAA